MSLHTTACPRNCYSTCTIQVEIEDGRLRRVLPHEGNRATAEGPCLKGQSYVERVNSPDRILHPLRRAADGRFERIGWDDALSTIANELREVRREHGPQSVLYYSGSGTKGLLNGVGASFWRLFGGYTGTYGDLCWPAGLEATRLSLGENKHSAPWDLARARCIVMWGKNPAETNIHQMPFVEEALRAGGRLVVVDPRRTESADRAQLLVQPRPGSDGALALGLAHVLFREKLVDREFLHAHVLGHAAFEQSVRACTPAWAAEISGVREESIEKLARILGTEAPLSICAGFGMQRYTNSGQAMRAIIALLVITGNIGRPGAGWIFANLQSAVLDSVKDPLAFYPPAQPDGIARISISTGRLGRDMLEATAPSLQFAWVERGNPLTQNPDTNAVRAAFQRLRFRVVVDQFLTDTAREADIVLPAKSFFEQSDVIGAYWHPYLQLKPRLLEPPGEVKPESEIYWELAARLGIPRDVVEAELPAPGETAVERWLEQRLSRVPGLSLKRMREGPMLPPGHQEIAFEDHVFATPSGKIELESAEAVQRWGVDALPAFHPPLESNVGAKESTTLQMLTPNTKNRIHSQFQNLEMIRAAGDERPSLAMSPVDAVPRGVRAGDRVRVFNERGSLEVEVRLDFAMRAGCVSMTNGWWATDGGSVNLLSAGRETDMGHGAAFHDNLVQVAKVSS